MLENRQDDAPLLVEFADKPCGEFLLAPLGLHGCLGEDYQKAASALDCLLNSINQGVPDVQLPLVNPDLRLVLYELSNSGGLPRITPGKSPSHQETHRAPPNGIHVNTHPCILPRLSGSL